MPDAGDFEKACASDSPLGWGDAFAGLPQDTPDAGGWQRLQARLPVASSPRLRRRWPLWLGAAASLGLALALPLWMSREAAIDLPAPAITQRTGTPPSMPANPRPLASTPSQAPRVRHDDDTAAEVDAIATAKAGSASTRSRPPRMAPAQRPIRTVAEPAGATRLASSDATTQRLESLYAESAQLEQLLAIVRDERVASGASAALSGELDSRVVAIDATLTQPALDDAQRADLWDQRVDALQQLVGIEATNRLYAARGQRYDAALVSVD